jgi:flagellar hook-length control protein FliK
VASSQNLGIPPAALAASHVPVPKVSLLDLRHSASRAADASRGAAKGDEAAKAPIGELKRDAGGDGIVRQLSLDQRLSSGTLAPGKAEGGRAPDFQSALAERLRDVWNGDIVQSAHIVLKDGDSGTIRLQLKPESLGNVKIELNLSDNNISGKIVVESDEAKSAFERNMSELADAFKQGGFDSARLEVSVGGGSGGGAESSRGDSQGPFFSERLRGALASSADPASATSAYARRGGAVDILA